MTWASEASSGNRTERQLRPLLCPLVCLLLCLLPAALPSPLLSQAPASPAADTPRSISVPGAPHASPSGEDAPDSPRATLHVYTNLMQVPVLVLDSDHEPLKPVPESKFRIRLDSGPPFKPTHVRREGDDPLQLAILIDETRPENELLPGIAAAVASLAPEALRPQDRVSIYVMDCGLIRTATNEPPDPARLLSAIETGMAGWRERRRRKPASPCKSGVQLFDAMTFITTDLMALPGRRVLLALTDGLDRGSRNNWNRLTRFEQVTSTAVFGLRSRQQMEDDRIGGFSSRESPVAAGFDHTNIRGEDRFDILCQSSGGLLFALGETGLRKGLVRFIQMLRDRYIIEYPRSNTATPGIHDLFVSIPDPLAYVRPAGISVPLADKKLLANPLTLPSQADVPVEGSRRVLDSAPETAAPAPRPAPPQP